MKYPFRDVAVITTAQRHSLMSKHRFCSGQIPARQDLGKVASG